MDLSTIRFTHRHGKSAPTAHSMVLTYPYLCVSLLVTRQTSNKRAFAGSSRGVQAGRFRVFACYFAGDLKARATFCPARSATSPRMGAKKVAHPARVHTSRRAHNDPETPDMLDRPVRASSAWRFTGKWEEREGKAPARVNPPSKKSQ